MADRKAVVKNADMSEEMQQDAIDCANQALEKFNIEKVRNNLGRTLPPLLKKSSTRSTTLLGTALQEEILDPMSLTKQKTSFTFILDKSPYFYSNPDEFKINFK